VIEVVQSPIESIERYTNRVKQDAYVMPFEAMDPTLADDLVVYLKNLSDKVLEITRFNVAATGAASIIRLQKVTGTAGGTLTVVNPTNKDLRLGNQLAGVVQAVTSPDITGLTEVSSVDVLHAVSAGNSVERSYPEGIILHNGDAVAIGVDTATAIITGAIHFIMRPEGE
jgi:hypothetical protein